MALSADTSIPQESQWVLGEGYGIGDGSIAAGTVVTVQAVCAPGTPGVGDDGTDTVLMGWLDGDTARSWTLPIAEFKERFSRKRGRRAG